MMVQFLNKISKLQKETMTGQESTKGEMEEAKKVAKQEQSKINQKKRLIEEELSSVQPTVIAAQQAVGNIDVGKLREVRNLRAPPDTIRDILEGVLKLMGNQDTSWTSMKSFLGQRGILDEIVNFDARKTPKEARKAVNELLSVRSS